MAEYTESVQPLYGYEWQAIYEAEFEGFKSMFAAIGGVLSLIIGLVEVPSAVYRSMARFTIVERLREAESGMPRWITASGLGID